MPPVDRVRLKDRRADLDLSLIELAKRLSISSGHLNNILGGSTTPSDRLIRRFSRVLDMTVDEIVLGKRTPQGDPSEPPRQPSREPAHPPRRQDKEPTKAPRRATGTAA